MTKEIFLILMMCTLAGGMCFADVGMSMPDEVDQRIAIINDTTIELKNTPFYTCPFGHEHVKRIPMIFGELAIDEELQRKIDNLEVWPAGCVVGDEKYQIVCPVCRYSYNPYVDAWEKDGIEPDEYEVPLHSDIDMFRQYFEDRIKTHSVNYCQRVKDLDHYQDHIGFFTRARKKDILKHVQDFIELKGVPAKRDQFDDQTMIWFEFQHDGLWFKITVTESVKDHKMVDFDVFHGEQDGFM